MAYKKLTDKNLEQQNEYLWDRVTPESMLNLIKGRSVKPVLFKYLHINDRIIEAGCGIGSWVYYLQNKIHEQLSNVNCKFYRTLYF